MFCPVLLLCSAVLSPTINAASHRGATYQKSSPSDESSRQYYYKPIPGHKPSQYYIKYPSKGNPEVSPRKQSNRPRYWKKSNPPSYESLVPKTRTHTRRPKIKPRLKPSTNSYIKPGNADSDTSGTLLSKSVSLVQNMQSFVDNLLPENLSDYWSSQAASTEEESGDDMKKGLSSKPASGNMHKQIILAALDGSSLPSAVPSTRSTTAVPTTRLTSAVPTTRSSSSRMPTKSAYFRKNEVMATKIVDDLREDGSPKRSSISAVPTTSSSNSRKPTKSAYFRENKMMGTKIVADLKEDGSPKPVSGMRKQGILTALGGSLLPKTESESKPQLHKKSSIRPSVVASDSKIDVDLEKLINAVFSDEELSGFQPVTASSETRTKKATMSSITAVPTSSSSTMRVPSKSAYFRKHEVVATKFVVPEMSKHVGGSTFNSVGSSSMHFPENSIHHQTFHEFNDPAPRFQEFHEPVITPHEFQEPARTYHEFKEPTTYHEFIESETTYHEVKESETIYHEFQEPETNHPKFHESEVTYHKFQKPVATYHESQESETTFHNFQKHSPKVQNFHEPATNYEIYDPATTSHQFHEAVPTTYHFSEPVSTHYEVHEPVFTHHQVHEPVISHHQVHEPVATHLDFHETGYTSHQFHKPIPSLHQFREPVTSSHQYHEPAPTVLNSHGPKFPKPLTSSHQFHDEPAPSVHNFHQPSSIKFHEPGPSHQLQFPEHVPTYHEFNAIHTSHEFLEPSHQFHEAASMVHKFNDPDPTFHKLHEPASTVQNVHQPVNTQDESHKLNELTQTSHSFHEPALPSYLFQEALHTPQEFHQPASHSHQFHEPALTFHELHEPLTAHHQIHELMHSFREPIPKVHKLSEHSPKVLKTSSSLNKDVSHGSPVSGNFHEQTSTFHKFHEHLPKVQNMQSPVDNLLPEKLSDYWSSQAASSDDEDLLKVDESTSSVVTTGTQELAQPTVFFKKFNNGGNFEIQRPKNSPEVGKASSLTFSPIIPSRKSSQTLILTSHDKINAIVDHQIEFVASGSQSHPEVHSGDKSVQQGFNTLENIVNEQNEKSEGVLAYLVSDPGNPGSDFLVTRTALLESSVLLNKVVKLTAYSAEAGGQVEIVDSKSLHLSGLWYTGPGPASWIVGTTFPIGFHSDTVILGPWRPGQGEESLTLPGQGTVGDINWLALYCRTCVESKLLMQVYIPETFL